VLEKSISRFAPRSFRAVISMQDTFHRRCGNLDERRQVLKDLLRKGRAATPANRQRRAHDSAPMDLGAVPVRGESKQAMCYHRGWDATNTSAGVDNRL